MICGSSSGTSEFSHETVPTLLWAVFEMIDLKVVWTRYESPSPDGPYQDWFDVDSILLKPNYDFLHSD